ncbi:MAG: hypothetical protein QOJ88_635 [Pyrinomonadaceae bacterium]|jgi:hypothetical protein|nr:hypothetical protein [Pyrinomonadaceae bacterium]MDQ1729800.1 hypothetical protein [Pyrinomonadaceae bacterium]
MKEAPDSGAGIGPGAAVVIVLHSPREKCWGVLDQISQAGVFLRGLDLNAFDDWLSAVVHGEPFPGFGDLFFPLWRVERIVRDEDSAGVPSLSEQVERRTGRVLADFLGTAMNQPR